jgi:hypothetical protein
MPNTMESTKAFPSWKHEVDQRMHFQFAITIVDAGIDDEELRKHWETELPPSDFVEWFATKYDLTSVAEWNGPLRVMC